MSSTHVLSPMLRKLMRWSALAIDDQRALLDLPVMQRTIGRGNYIVRDGDRPTKSCVLVSGFVYRHKVVGDGGRQILALHHASDFVDLQNALLRESDHSVQALTQSEIAEVPCEAIRRIAAARPAIGQAMWHETLVDASIQREWTANIGRRSARARVSHLLCEIGVRLQDAGLGRLCRYELPMTQEDLADALGLTPVHVNRTLMALSREGVADKRRNSVFIHDWQSLAAIGDFSPGYLHRNEQRPTVLELLDRPAA